MKGGQKEDRKKNISVDVNILYMKLLEIIVTIKTLKK